MITPRVIRQGLWVSKALWTEKGNLECFGCYGSPGCYPSIGMRNNDAESDRRDIKKTGMSLTLRLDLCRFFNHVNSFPWGMFVFTKYSDSVFSSQEKTQTLQLRETEFRGFVPAQTGVWDGGRGGGGKRCGCGRLGTRRRARAPTSLRGRMSRPNRHSGMGIPR